MVVIPTAIGIRQGGCTDRGGYSSGKPYVYNVLDWSSSPGIACGVAGVIMFVVFPLTFCACVRIKRAACCAAYGEVTPLKADPAITIGVQYGK